MPKHTNNVMQEFLTSSRAQAEPSPYERVTLEPLDPNNPTAQHFTTDTGRTGYATLRCAEDGAGTEMMVHMQGERRKKPYGPVSMSRYSIGEPVKVEQHVAELDMPPLTTTLIALALGRKGKK